MMDTNPRAALAAAIRDYVQWAHGRPGQQQLLESLEGVRREVEALPNPVSQGPGVVPEQRPGSSGARPPLFPKADAVVAMQQAHGSSNEA